MFWNLTVREFHLKHGAFIRAENRARALIIEHALMTGHIDPKKQKQVEKTIHALRQYPIKKWLRPD